VAAACRAGDEVVKTRIAIGPAETAVAGSGLPAVLPSLVVARLEDLSAECARSALEQSPEATGGTDLQSVWSNGARLHLPVGRGRPA
jgi:hypothetical protein